MSPASGRVLTRRALSLLVMRRGGGPPPSPRGLFRLPGGAGGAWGRGSPLRRPWGPARWGAATVPARPARPRGGGWGPRPARAPPPHPPRPYRANTGSQLALSKQPPPNLPVSNRDVRRLALTRVVPVGLVVGAGMEVFMYFTGFWDVALRKAAEREMEARDRAAKDREAVRARAAQT